MKTVYSGWVTFVLASVLALCAICPAICEPLVKAGDRVVFLGDSITQQRGYTRYVTDYFSLRYPGADITFRNTGLSGGTAPRGVWVLDTDVLNLKPTVVVICFGLNDMNPSQPLNDALLDLFIYGIKNTVRDLKKENIKVVLMSTVSVDTSISPRMKSPNETLARAAGLLKEIAVEEKLPYVNLHGLMLEVQQRVKSKGPKYQLTADGVHTRPTGDAVIAYALLKAMGCDEPASGLSIDASGMAASAYRCDVKNLSITESEISFDRTDHAFPTYFDPEAEPIFEYVSVVEDLNQYPFKVSGLSDGKWKLTVAKTEVGTFTTAQLAEGINAATYPGPWKVLGERINRMVMDQDNIFFYRWREIGLVQMPDEALPEYLTLLAKLDAYMEEQDRARMKASEEDHTWRWTLTKVEKDEN